MKFLRLEILNLASLDHPEGEIIDFERGALGEATIFSIVGPTGSGKSTLLDAICLALYNRAPRYPKKKGDKKAGIEIYGTPETGENNRLAPTDSRNILTRGRRIGFSKLTFRANSGVVYRAEWHVKFNYRNYEKALTLLYTVAPDGSETEAEWSDLPRIIGLDYEQFLRTVLIAQGSFAGFLNAREDERAELLEKLIGAEDKYTAIADAIRVRKSEANETLRTMRADHAAYARFDLTEEQLASLRDEIARLEKEEQDIRDEQTRIEAELGWYVALREFQDKATRTVAELSESQEALAQRQSDAEKLKLYDSTRGGITLYADSVKARRRSAALDESIVEVSAMVEDVRKSVKLAEECAELKRTEHDAAEKSLADAKPHIQRARELNTELRGLSNRLREITNEKKKLSSDVTKTGQDLTENGQRIETLSQTLSNLAEEKRTAVEASAGKIDDLKNRYEESDKELRSLRDQLARLNPEQTEDIKKSIESVVKTLRLRKDLLEKLEDTHKKYDAALKETDTLTARNSAIEEEMKGIIMEPLEGEIKVLNDTRLLITGADWKAQRRLLREGEACPLCGGLHHPYADEEIVESRVSELDSLLDRKQKQYQDLLHLRDTLREEYNRNAGMLERLKNNVITERSLIEDYSARLSTTSEDNMPSPTTVSEAAELLSGMESKLQETEEVINGCTTLRKGIDKVTKDTEKLRKHLETERETATTMLNEFEKRRSELNTALAEERGRTEGLSVRLAELQETLKRIDGDIHTLENEIADHNNNIVMEVGKETPDALESRLTEDVKTGLTALKDAEKSLMELREKVKELTGQLSTLKVQKCETDTEMHRLESELDDWILNYSFTTTSRIDRETLIALATSEEDWEALRLSLKETEERVTVARTRLDEVNKAINVHEKKHPEMSEDELKARIGELKAHTTTRLDEARARLCRYNEARDKMGEMYELLKKAEATAADWNAISEAIGGDGKTLRKIAQCYTLSFLIEHANREIRRFNTRYELRQVRNSLGIRVIDHERGDDMRDTTSLSGGETFIVSLGLALGLSSLSSRNVSFDNLFIDEGFGSLDPDTLSTVIDSLAMLQGSQGKKVGVISHTDTMSERIPTQIRILRNGRSGSSRIEIYP